MKSILAFFLSVFTIGILHEKVMKVLAIQVIIGDFIQIQITSYAPLNRIYPENGIVILYPDNYIQGGMDFFERIIKYVSVKY